MPSRQESKRFGLPSSVEDHLAMLGVLTKNDNKAIDRCWKGTNNNDRKVMLFHTLAMLDPERLHTWIATTPVTWWEVQPKVPKEHASIQSRYNMIAGGMLHHLHLANHGVFMDLLSKSPHVFKTESCRHYMSDWCQTMRPEDLTTFQGLLALQPPSWYTTEPQRVMLLTSAESHPQQEAMLAAATAKNGVVHPLLEKKYPGIQSYIGVVHSMLGDTKQKKAFLRKWMVNQVGPQAPVVEFALPDLGF